MSPYADVNYYTETFSDVLILMFLHHNSQYEHYHYSAVSCLNNASTN